MAKRGRPPKPPPIGINGLSDDDQKRVANIVQRVEALEQERAEIVEPYDADIAQVYADAAKMNFHVPTLRRIVRERALEATKRQQRDNLLDSYRHALGMLADTPLGRAALERDGEPVKRRGRKRKPSADPGPAAGPVEAPTNATTSDAAAIVDEAPATSGGYEEAIEDTTAAVAAIANGEPVPTPEEIAGETVEGMRRLRAAAAADAAPDDAPAAAAAPEGEHRPAETATSEAPR